MRILLPSMIARWRGGGGGDGEGRENREGERRRKRGWKIERREERGQQELAIFFISKATFDKTFSFSPKILAFRSAVRPKVF